jgi:hypothetical protein
MRGKKFGGAGVEPTESARRGRPDDGQRNGNDVDGMAAADPAEHLTRDLARVRAKFGVDPALAGRSLAAAWKSETPLEEDEAEFVDAVADCLVAGLSLDDALNCWDNGDLAYEASEDGSGADGDPDREDETVPIPLPAPRRSSTAHRVLVR